MKKNIFKLMTAVVATAALASCSDDLSLGTQTISADADLTATISEDPDANFTRLGISEVEGTNPWDDGKASNWGWVFTKGDQVRVFTLEQMIYNYYDLIRGENSKEGEFQLNQEMSSGVLSEGQKYALTDAQFVYGVSPLGDGSPRLTYTIPYKYSAKSIEVAEGDDPDVDVRKFPAPFWGKATEVKKEGSEEVGLSVNFMALTAFLRIDMQELPANTKYIVLTTHGVKTEMPDGTIWDDGFKLATPETDENGNWTHKIKYTDNGSGEYTETIDYEDNLDFWKKVKTTTGGQSEKLSGTFNAILENKFSMLGEDKGLENEKDGDDWGMEGISRLTNRDEIVIDVTKYDADEEGIFWIPIIAKPWVIDEKGNFVEPDVEQYGQDAYYNHLHVLAVTEFSKYTYTYVGTELKEFVRWSPKVGSRHKLTMNMMNLGKVCAHDLNQAIKEINKKNKYNLRTTNVINVDELTDCCTLGHEATIPGATYHNDEATFPTDQIFVQGDAKANLVLNIAKINAGTGVKHGCTPIRTDLTTNANQDDYNPDKKLEKRTLFVSDRNYWPETAIIRACADYAGFTEDDVLGSTTINLPAKSDNRKNVEVLMSDLPTYDVVLATNNNFYPGGQTDAKDLRVDVHASATKYVTGHDVEEIDENNHVADVKDMTEAAVKVVNGFGILNILQKSKGDVYLVQETDQKVEITDRINVWTNAGISTRLDNALVKYIFTRGINLDTRLNNIVTTGTSAIQRIGVLGKEFVEDPNLKVNETTWPFDKKYFQPNDVALLPYWTGYALDIEAENIGDYDNGMIYTAAQLASMGEEISQTANDKSEKIDKNKDVTCQYYMSGLMNSMWLGGYKYPWIGPEVTVKNFVIDGNHQNLKNMNMPNVAKSWGDGMSERIYYFDPHICCTTCGWKREPKDIDDKGGEIALKSWGLIRSIINEGGEENVIENIKLNDVYAVPEKDGKPYAACDHVGSLVGLVISDHDLTLDNNQVGEIQINVPNKFVGGLIGHVLDSKNVLISHNSAANSSYDAGYIKGVNDVGGFIGRLGKSDRDNIMNENITDIPVTDNIPSLTITDSQVNMAGNIEASGARAGGLGGNVWTDALDINTTSVQAANIISKGQGAAGLVASARDHKWLDRTATANIEEVAVTVPGKISSDKYSGGLLGSINFNQVDLVSADIEVGTINATEGCAGGEVGYAIWGTFNVGDENEDDVLNETNIAIKKMSGSYAVGGVFGTLSNNAYAYVYTGQDWVMGMPPKFVGNKTSIEITEFVNSKGVGSDALKDVFKGDYAKRYGTFSNIAGEVEAGEIRISEAALEVKDHMTGKMKEDIGYLLHADQTPAPDPNAPANEKVRYFWGDSNGYVGYGKGGCYWLSDDNAGMSDAYLKPVGDQALDQVGFNLYKSKLKYAETSKNFVAAE